jgi:segregation and condensation protein B
MDTQVDIKNIIESLLFVAEDPLTIDSIKKVLDSTDSNAIRNVLNELSSEYEARKGGFFLREVAGGYQIRTRSEYSQWIRRLLRPNPLRLSNAALETLAIVAYKQPVIRSDIEHLRGVDCGGILRMLLERKLIRVVGRKEIPGRPMIYTTTKKFLELFELKDLKDLPSPKEIEELGDSSSESFPHTVPEIIKQTGDEDTKNS